MTNGAKSMTQKIITVVSVVVIGVATTVSAAGIVAIVNRLDSLSTTQAVLKDGMQRNQTLLEKTYTQKDAETMWRWIRSINERQTKRIDDLDDRVTTLEQRARQ